jgi:hypothetical protein
VSTLLRKEKEITNNKTMMKMKRRRNQALLLGIK